MGWFLDFGGEFAHLQPWEYTYHESVEFWQASDWLWSRCQESAIWHPRDIPPKRLSELFPVPAKFVWKWAFKTPVNKCGGQHYTREESGTWYELIFCHLSYKINWHEHCRTVNYIWTNLYMYMYFNWNLAGRFIFSQCTNPDGSSDSLSTVLQNCNISPNLLMVSILTNYFLVYVQWITTTVSFKYMHAFLPIWRPFIRTLFIKHLSY